MGIAVHTLVPVSGISTREMILAVRAAAEGHPIRAISVAVVDDATMVSLHERYLKEATSTDVMSFDLRDEQRDAAIDGEIVVCAEAARRQAGCLGVTFRQELLRYLIHGTLHLIGYNDATAAQRKRMRRQEDRILATLTRDARASRTIPRKGPSRKPEIGPAGSRSHTGLGAGATGSGKGSKPRRT